MFISRISPENVVAQYEFQVVRNHGATPDESRRIALTDILWNTMGPANARLRQQLMHMFTGTKLPQAKCGVNALIEAATRSTLFPVPQSATQEV